MLAQQQSASSSRRTFLSLLSSTPVLLAPPPPSNAALAPPPGTIIPRLAASWSAVNGLVSAKDSGLVAFETAAYEAMRDDAERTGGFDRAIRSRLARSPPGTEAVLDIGTGPFALLALQAARAGARVVYAVEADPQAFRLAEAAVRAATDVPPGVVVLIRGRSTDVTLPEKVDLVLAELVGSVASEEGILATLVDAQKRHAKKPHDAASWIPQACETLCAPASFALHSFVRANGGKPVRLNCRDETLQLLSEPRVLERIVFSDPQLPGAGRWEQAGSDGFSFELSAERIAAAAAAYRTALQASGSSAEDAAALSNAVASSVSGLALWPRLTLAEGDCVLSRGAAGEPRNSHWQTVLPLLCATPVPVTAGDTLEVHSAVDLPEGLAGEAPFYLLEARLRGADGEPVTFKTL
jgi:protein arginine N-methyltransferase 1